jgi:hypothetical protein
MKKIFILLFIFFNSFFVVFAWKMPPVNCAWVPGCPNDDVVSNPTAPNISTTKVVTEFLSYWIGTLIKYTAVIAVISLMCGGVLYILSWGKEDKMKKAKWWIIWSLVWVFFSVSAWFIINVINEFKIP